MRSILSLSRCYLVTISALLFAGVTTPSGGAWHNHAVFVLYLCAILASAYFDGMKAGLATTGLCAVLLAYQHSLLPEPLTRPAAEFTTTLAVFCLLGVLASYLSYECFRSIRAAVRLHNTVASCHDGIILADSRGRVTYLNRAARTLTGWQAKEALGRPVEQICAIRGEEAQSLASHPLAGVPEGEVCLPARRGTVIARHGAARPVEYWAEPLEDAGDSAPGASFFLRDLSSRLEAEKAEQLIRALPEAASVGLVWLEPGGRCTYGNPVAQSLGHPAPAEVLTDAWARSLHPEDLEAMGEWRASAMRGRPYVRELRFHDDEGKENWFQLRSEVARSRQGQVLGHVGTLQDITEFKQLGNRLAEQERLADAARLEAHERLEEGEGRIAELEQETAGLRKDVAGRQQTEEQLRRQLDESSDAAKTAQAQAAQAQEKEAGLRQELEALRRAEASLKKEAVEAQRKEASIRREMDMLRQQEQSRHDTLRQDAEFLRLALDHLDAGVIAWRDVDEPIVNPAARRLLGLGKGQLPADRWLAGLPFHSADGRSPNAAEENPFEPAMRRETFGPIEILAAAPSDRVLTASGWLLAGSDGKAAGYVMTLQDVSGPRRGEREARAAHDHAGQQLRFAQSVLRSLPEGVCALDPAGTITYANPAAERLLGSMGADLMGRSLHDFLKAPPDRPLSWTGPGRRDDLSVPRGRTPLPVACNVAPLSEDEVETGVAVLVQDWSGPRQREEAWQSRLRTMEEAAHGIQGLWLRMADQFQPLATCLPETLAAVLPAGGNRTVREALDRHARPVSQLAETWWLASRLVRGDLAVRAEPVDLARILKRAVDGFHAWLCERGQHLTVLAPLQSPSLVGDPTLLEPMLVRLLDHAGQRSGNGSEVGLSVEREGNQVVIRVRDQGSALSAAEAGRLGTLSARARSFGEKDEMGLAVARDLVEIHGGTLTIVGTPDAPGCELTARLPASGIEPAGPVQESGTVRADEAHANGSMSPAPR